MKSSPQTRKSRKLVAQMLQEATLLAEQGQWKQAAATLQILIAQTPQDEELSLRLAHCQRQAHDLKGAAQTLQNAISQRAAVISSGQTSSPQSSTRSSNAATQSEREIEQMQLALCEVFAESQNWAGCLEACQQLLQIAPRNLNARELLATSFLHLGRVAEAENTVRELLIDSPRDPLHRIKLATLLQIQGRSGEALNEFERVVAVYSDAPFTAEAREAIELLDNLQIQQIVMRLNEQPQFEQQLRADMTTTLRENSFHLTDEGRESLRHMMSDGRPEIAPPKVFLH